jgi:hypothetical protein
MPGAKDSLKTPFHPKTPCEKQDPPNLQAVQGPAPQQEPISSALPSPTKVTALKDYGQQWMKSQDLAQQGETTQAAKALGQGTQAYDKAYGTDSTGSTGQ